MGERGGVSEREVFRRDLDKEREGLNAGIENDRDSFGGKKVLEKGYKRVEIGSKTFAWGDKF